MTNAEARFNNSLRPKKPEGSLGRTAQDVHLDSHTAELCLYSSIYMRPAGNIYLKPQVPTLLRPSGNKGYTVSEC